MEPYQRAQSLFTSATFGPCQTTVTDEIHISENISVLFLGINTVFNEENQETDFTFIFESTISGVEETELDSIISNHTGKPTPLTDLENEQLKALTMIDEAAGEARARFITTTAGQSAVYTQKAKNSKKYQDDGNPTIDENNQADIDNYPFVISEKRAKNHSDYATAAATVLYTEKEWDKLAATMEEIRLNYKDQVNATTDGLTAKALGHKGKALLDQFKPV